MAPSFGRATTSIVASDGSRIAEGNTVNKPLPINLEPPPSVQCLSDSVFLPAKTLPAAARAENSSTVTIWDRPTTSRDDSASQLMASTREEDGEDDIMFVDSTKRNKPEERANFVQEEDDGCIIEDIVPRHIKFSRRKKRKIQCPKCSKKFFTRGSCDEHLREDHRADKGSQTSVKGTYGLPYDESRNFYICVMCSIIYEDPKFFQKHMSETHENCPPIVCPLCPCVGFNKKGSEAHWELHQRYAKASGVPNMCVEHNVVFGKNIELMFHANWKHDAKLLFFCKKCFLASMNGATIVRHFKTCKTVKRPNETFPASTNLEGEQALGVISVNTVNFQPADEKAWIQRLASPNPPSTAVPSQCNHKTLVADKYPSVLCSDKNCNTWYLQPAYTGTFEDQAEKVEELMARERTILQSPWLILNRTMEMPNPQNLPFYVRLKAAYGASTIGLPFRPPLFRLSGSNVHSVEESLRFSPYQILSTPQDQQVPTVKRSRVQGNRLQRVQTTLHSGIVKKM
ncbi:unnamed protein product, partial [Mesorhabditis belari]|uniref:C2H2-type domain-containing protein n=1 Tax=Mesorhabditis belari TaxID=2138241 RepID=A0AAF3F747_9BILA